MAEIWRGNLSTNGVALETQSMKIGDKYVRIPRRPWLHYGGAFDGDSRKGMYSTATVASKGGGYTTVKIWWGSNEFKDIVQMMLQADRPSAMEAIREALDSAPLSTA